MASRRIGVVLAAGRSRRMGRTKQLMPWPNETAADAKPLVAAAVDAIRPICDAMVVVVGHDADAVRNALADRDCEFVDSDADGTMFDSAKTGIRYAVSIDAACGIALHPGDHPQVANATLALLTSAAIANADRAVMPEFAGQGGHPVIIPADIATRILTAKTSGGLREFWREHPQHCLRVAVDDPDVVRDIDTPADW